MAPGTPTTSRPATEPDSRDNRDLTPDQQKSHMRFGKRTTSKVAEWYAPPAWHQFWPFGRGVTGIVRELP
ncbi:hypothetical protein GCM10010250_69910 [Streptomyces althioticus]|nr:hypothetical protein GCM10010250_69910 [Streptomyces althioticus]